MSEHDEAAIRQLTGFTNPVLIMEVSYQMQYLVVGPATDTNGGADNGSCPLTVIEMARYAKPGDEPGTMPPPTYTQIGVVQPGKKQLTAATRMIEFHIAANI